MTLLPTSDLSPWPVPRADLLETLFNELPDVVFFLKDRDGRYTAANRTLLDRCGIAHRESLLGRTAEEVFPSPLGTGYTAQDRQVLRPASRPPRVFCAKAPVRSPKSPMPAATAITVPSPGSSGAL